MKKAYLFTLITLLSLTACQNKKTIDQKGANVFPASTIDESLAITMGDVMPFYDNGMMNIYHLRNITGSNPLFYHPIARLTTSDYIHYVDEGVVIDYEEKITSPDAALGTGSFIKDNDGIYHCFYTGHNGGITDPDLGNDRRPFIEVIRHATSPDQITWTKDENFNLYGHENDFRDPYVYFDRNDSKYYMLVTTRESGAAVIRRFESNSLNAGHDGWTVVPGADFFVNDEGSYNMECPSYVEFNGFQYLAYSEQGENRVTHYRYRRNNNEPWQRFERDAIDAAGFYAGRIEKAGDKLFAFAWCARLTGGSTGGFDWAGNLVTHELIQNDRGELCPVMPYTYKDYFKNPVEYKNNKNKVVSNYSFNGEKFMGTTLSKKSTLATRMSMKITPRSASGDFGLSFGIGSFYDNRLGNGVLAFDLSNNKLVAYNNVSSIIRYGNELTHVNYAFELGKEYTVDVIAQGEIAVIYLNNEIALTARMVDLEDNYFAFYSNNAKADITEVAFYE